MAAPPPTISTHVLDLGRGEPATGVPVAIFRLSPAGQPELLGEMTTDPDGRIADLLSGAELIAGDYQLVFDMAAYADQHDDHGAEPAFFENLALGFHVDDVGRGYHVPLLLSPWSYSTYRGS